jgi:Ca2+-binding EF-hand superfamily protein
LLRVVRSIKGLKIVAGLWLIVQGILDSIRTVFWVTLVAIVSIYCFAVALCTLAGHEESIKERWPLADIYVGSVGKSMMTVMQVITLDSWTEDIARPLLEVSPVTLAILMLAVVWLTFGTLNILVAVMVERISSISQDSKLASQKVLEKTENTLLRSIAMEFDSFDTEGRGQLDFSAFRKMIRTKSLSNKLGLLGIQVDEAEGLFDLMDVDRSGTVTPGEFIAGLQKLKGSAKGQDVVQLICFAQKQVLRATRFVERLEELNYSADKIQERLNIVGRSLGSEIGERRDAAVRVENTWQNAAERQLVIRQLDIDRQHRYPVVEAEEEEDDF